jgi:hypothetical protein
MLQSMKKSLRLFKFGLQESLLVISLVEFFLSGSLFILTILVISMLSLYSKENLSLGHRVARGLLVFISAFSLMLVLAPRLNAPLHQREIVIILFFAFAFLSFKTHSRFRLPKTISHDSLVPMIAPFSILSIALFSYMKFGRTMAWVMSGDAKNHISIVRSTVDNGGISSFPGYPALANAVVGLMGGWRFDLDYRLAGDLKTEVRVFGLVLLMLLALSCFLVAHLSHSIASHSKKWRYITVIVLSFLPISNLWLYPILEVGFFPISLLFVILVAFAIESRALEKVGPFYLGLTVFSTIAVVLTYPPAAPIILAIAANTLGQLRTQYSQTWIRRLQPLLTALFIGISARVIYLIPDSSRLIEKYLELNGLFHPFSKWPLYFSTLIALILSFSKNLSTRWFANASIVVAATALSTDVFLDSILQNTYYLEKTRWVASCFLMLLVLIALFNAISSSQRRSARLLCLPVLLIVVVVSMRSIAQNYPTNSIALDITRDWQLPSADEVRLIEKTNALEPESMFWKVSPNYLATQVIDIWITIGAEDRPENTYFGYQQDVFSLEAVCNYAKSNIPTTIWVPSASMVEVVSESCASSGVSVRQIER